MPGGDGTGPGGMGPMTGRAAGYCAGYPVPGYMNPIAGRGGGWGYGRGMGWRRGWGRGGGRGRGWRGAYGPAYGYGAAAVPPPAFYGAAPTAEQELVVLRQQAQAMQQGLEELNGRIQELEKEAGTETK